MSIPDFFDRLSLTSDDHHAENSTANDMKTSEMVEKDIDSNLYIHNNLDLLWAKQAGPLCRFPQGRMPFWVAQQNGLETLGVGPTKTWPSTPAVGSHW